MSKKMSRKILHATCSTVNPQTGNHDWVNFLENTSNYDPARLVVFVGERGPSSAYSSLASTGGILARQLFKWENYPTKDVGRYFVDFQQASVTLTVILQPKVGANASLSTTFTGELPSDTMAINLSSKFNQGTVDNGINEDVWGKLVYYDTGALGQGMVFSPADYVSLGGANGSGIFFNGGALPDYNDYKISLAIQNSTTTARTPSANLQMGRSNSLLSQAVLGNVVGMSGYWSLGIEPVDSSQIGNICGQVANANLSTATTFTPWMHFGTPTVGYPSYATTNGSSTGTQYWQAVNPQYGRGSADGMMRCGNCISIAPSTFMTDFGFSLLSSPASNPGGSDAIESKRWTTYFSKAGTSYIQLKETQPVYFPSPISSGPLPLEMIPGGINGLYMLVPVTRVMNGVTFYVPFTNSVRSGLVSNLLSDLMAYSSASLTGEATSFYRPAQGLIYSWFDIFEIKMTLNVPSYRLDSVEEVRRFFGTVLFEPSLVRESSLWLKWSMTDVDDPIATTVDLLALNSMQKENKITFNITARGILDKIAEVFSMYGVSQTSQEWPTNVLSIRQVCAMCTTTWNLRMLYENLYNVPKYLQTPVGSILSNGGTKVYGRQGPNLSGGPPYSMTVTAQDITNSLGEFDNSTNTYFVEIDSLPPLSTSRFQRNNDFVTTCPMAIAGTYPTLRIPNLNSSNDQGGTLTVEFFTSAYMNLPWSGPSTAGVAGGGPGLSGFTSSTTINSTILSNYDKGWFNNLNPYSSDYLQGSILNDTDKWIDLDSRLVDFNARAVEVWVEVGVQIPVYSSFPTAGNTTSDDVYINTNPSTASRAFSNAPQSQSMTRSRSRRNENYEIRAYSFRDMYQ